MANPQVVQTVTLVIVALIFVLFYCFLPTIVKHMQDGGLIGSRIFDRPDATEDGPQGRQYHGFFGVTTVRAFIASFRSSGFGSGTFDLGSRVEASQSLEQGIEITDRDIVSTNTMAERVDSEIEPEARGRNVPVARTAHFADVPIAARATSL